MASLTKTSATTPTKETTNSSSVGRQPGSSLNSVGSENVAESVLDLTNLVVTSPKIVSIIPSTPTAGEEKSSLKRSSSTSEDEWPSTSDGYLLGAKIGSGAFAVVHHAKSISGMDCAVKIIKLGELEEEDNTQMMEEILMMRNFKHENILSLYCSFNTRRNHVDELWLVMPFMNLGSALRVLNMRNKKGSGEGCGEQATRALCQATLQGLMYLHDQGIVHRDVKAGNILLDSSGAVCIADFGVSSWLRNRNGLRDHSEGVAATFVGTPCWMAPEVMEQNNDGYAQAADIWSFGITALELAKGYAPYYSLNPMSVVVKTLQEDPPNLSS
jgi:serine/threonine-protein kinase OSR1/STK39